MAITQDGVYTYVQDLFRRGVVMIVGSGASSAHGLPGMADLADFLRASMPDLLCDADDVSRLEWSRVSHALEHGVGLESAIGDNALPEALADALTGAIAQCVGRAEAEAIARIIHAETPSPLGRLFEFMLRSASRVDVITTNYDRLIEVHAAKAKVRVDSMYYGHTIGRLDPAASREELYTMQRSTVRRGSGVSARTRPHIRLSKPHGSLDWFENAGEYFRSDLAIPGSRQVIAPGGNKYRLGYEIPFDRQRVRANQAINEAASILAVGYGFNDEHLQTHLRAKFAQVPSVVLSRTLTQNALSYLNLNSTAIGIESIEGGLRSRIVQADSRLDLDVPIWDIEHLIKEVLNL